jgi:hypothetical protein
MSAVRTTPAFGFSRNTSPLKKHTHTAQYPFDLRQANRDRLLGKAHQFYQRQAVDSEVVLADLAKSCLFDLNQTLPRAKRTSWPGDFPQAKRIAMNPKAKRIRLLVAALVAYCGILPALAGTPQVRKYQTVEYLTGGVGIDEVDAMHAVVKDYNLSLQFAAKGSGAFLSDVDVNVRDRAGKTLLAAKSEGPCLFAKMPPGQYNVTASFEGKEQKKTASVEAKQRAELYFYFLVQTEAVAKDTEKPASPTRHPDCT